MKNVVHDETKISKPDLLQVMSMMMHASFKGALVLVGRVHIEFDCTDIFYFAQPCFERATGNSCLVEVAVALLQLSAYSDIDVEKGVDRTP